MSFARVTQVYQGINVLEFLNGEKSKHSGSAPHCQHHKFFCSQPGKKTFYEKRIQAYVAERIFLVRVWDEKTWVKGLG